MFDVSQAAGYLARYHSIDDLASDESQCFAYTLWQLFGGLS